MTVKYNSNFFFALFHWRGSVWKSIWPELLIWLILYYGLRVTLFIIIIPLYTQYDDLLRVSNFSNLSILSTTRSSLVSTTPINETIKNVVEVFYISTTLLPVEFLLSFYVNQAVSRWWAQISLLPWPDETMAHACSVLSDNDEDTRCRRRSVGRYLVVSIILALKNVSTQAARLYPDLKKLEFSGLLTRNEREILDQAVHKDVLYEIPLQWIHEAVRSKFNSTQGSMLLSLNAFRNQLRNLTHYSVMSLPLVYTQTATVAVYGYFLFALIGEIHNETDFDPYFPFLSSLRFIFVVGWLKVAQDLAKPFGNDDDDVDINEWVDRHIRFVFTVADYSMDNMPMEGGWLKDQTTLSEMVKRFPPNPFKHGLSITDKMRNVFNIPIVTKF